MTACRNGDHTVSPHPNLRGPAPFTQRLTALCIVMAFLVLAGCSLDAPPTEVYINQATAIALTPTVTPTPPPPTATPTLAPTATTPPTPTQPPTATAAPSATVAPTPTTNPQLADLGYCRTQFGPPDGARFSARLVSIDAQRLELVDQITLTFSDTQGLLHGTASCIDNAEWPLAQGSSGDAEAPGEKVLLINLDDWAHDEAWAQSALTETQTLTGTTAFSRVSFAADPLASRGTAIGIGLERPLPYRVRLEEQPTQLVIEVDRNARIEAAEDPLGRAAGRIEAPEQPIFFLQNYDVWRFDDGRARPVTTTNELETSLAVSPDGETLAVCRAPRDTEPSALPYDVRASLWVMRASGGDERLLADIGGCADLRFAPSGRTLSFTANTAVAPPAILSVWTVPVVVGEPKPATPLADEWNRFDAAWLPDSRLIYRARHDSGLQVLFIREDDGLEREVSAPLLTGADYSGIGEFIVGEDLLAVEALRAGEDGADLAVLRFDGSEVAVERRAFWQRPLAFIGDALVYLGAECPSGVVLPYTLLRRAADGTVDELLEGQTLGAFGDALAIDDQLLISRIADPTPGVKGPRAMPADGSQGSLWLVAADGSARRELLDAPVPILSPRAAP